MKIVTTKQLAELAGLSPRAVRKAGIPGGPLADARLPGRRGWDLDSDAAADWLEAHGTSADLLDPAVPRRPAKEVAAELGDTAGDPLEAIGDMPFRAVIERYGTEAQFHGWVRARKELAQARLHEERLESMSGRLLPRAAFDLPIQELDTLSQRLLKHTAATAALELRAMVEAGRPVEEVRAHLRDLLTQEFAIARDRLSRCIASIVPTAAPPPVHLKGKKREHPPPIEPKLARALEEALAAAADACVTSTAKAIAHAAAGKPWHDAAFVEAVELHEKIEADTKENAREHVAGALEETVRKYRLGELPSQEVEAS